MLLAFKGGLDESSTQYYYVNTAAKDRCRRFGSMSGIYGRSSTGGFSLTRRVSGVRGQSTGTAARDHGTCDVVRTVVVGSRALADYSVRLDTGDVLREAGVSVRIAALLR